jgi:glycosyltransferase involved in cell wall biosynthesis
MLKVLARVGDFAEWVVLDTGSTDRTAEIAAEMGATVRSAPWQGFSLTRRGHFAMAGQPWILWIDADEEVTVELVEELRALFAKGPGHAAYRINRVMFFAGKWIRRGDWYPDRVLRLFRADAWTLPVREVHESVEINGTVSELQSELPHYSYRDWADRNRRLMSYAEIWAKQEAAKGRRCKPLEGELRAAWRFIRGYVLKAGFLEGAMGLRIAISCAREVLAKYRALGRRG